MNTVSAFRAIVGPAMYVKTHEICAKSGWIGNRGAPWVEAGLGFHAEDPAPAIFGAQFHVMVG